MEATAASPIAAPPTAAAENPTPAASEHDDAVNSMIYDMADWMPSDIGTDWKDPFRFCQCLNGLGGEGCACTDGWGNL
jgi:hypothetical protein